MHARRSRRDHAAASAVQLGGTGDASAVRQMRETEMMVMVVEQW